MINYYTQWYFGAYLPSGTRDFRLWGCISQFVNSGAYLSKRESGVVIGQIEMSASEKARNHRQKKENLFLLFRELWKGKSERTVDQRTRQKRLPNNQMFAIVLGWMMPN